MALLGIEVTIRMPIVPGPGQSKAASLDAAEEGRIITRGAQKVITLRGAFSERDLQVLKNASRFCPVAQLFSGKSLQMEDAFEVAEA